MISENEFAESIRVENGNPTPAELAAAIAVLLEVRSQQQGRAIKPRSSWSRNSSMLRGDNIIGPGQWRSSYHQGI